MIIKQGMRITIIRRTRNSYSELTTVMKLMWRFFMDSKPENNYFKSNFVTWLKTLASSMR